MKEKIELMAPAGSYQALEAAVNAGADAVYLGGSRFGARQYADNFDSQELKKAVQFTHLRGVRLYVTVNTLVADSEMEAVADYLAFLYNIGVDAIIVQDIGICAIAREITPNLPLFASTQMTVTDASSVKLAEQWGFSRVVLPRETSLKDIREICRQANCEIEVFVHGALCMSYSGQCLMSSLISARSGNRGQCSQPCRLPYILTDESGKEARKEPEIGKYLLSPRDLNAIELLPELIQAGVSSFKIEGRMKRPEYVAVVTSIYRKAIDSFLAGEFCVSQDDHRDLRQVFNRDFTTGYLMERPGRALLSDKRPNNRGVQVGRLSAFDKKGKCLEIKLEETISTGDELDIWVKVGGRAGLKAANMQVNSKAVQKANKGETVRLPCEHAVSVNDRVFRTFDFILTKKARTFFGQEAQNALPVHGCVKVEQGLPLSIIFTDDMGNKGEGQTDFLAETAQKHSLTAEAIEKQLQRLGDTDFYLESFTLDLKSDLMVPVSEINKARRHAIEDLQKKRLDKFLARDCVVAGRVTWPEKIVRKKKEPALSVHVDSVEKLRTALDADADIIIFGGESYSHRQMGVKQYKEALNICQKAGKQIFFATPRILMQDEMDAFLALVEIYHALEPDGLLISSLAAFEVLCGKGLPLWLDYSLNTFNSFAVSFWREQGVAGVTLSQEVNFNQLTQLQDILPLECVVHGRMEMMVTQYCAIGALLGKGTRDSCSMLCQKGNYFLKDRMGEYFPLVADQFCRMHVLNAKELCAVDQLDRFVEAHVERLRIDGRFFTAQELATIVRNYKNALSGMPVTMPENITRGHYFRGVV